MRKLSRFTDLKFSKELIFANIIIQLLWLISIISKSFCYSTERLNNANNLQRMDATDLDAVLENISLLIEDMEENINDTKVFLPLFFVNSKAFLYRCLMIFTGVV